MGDATDMDGSLMVGKGDTLSFEDMRDEERQIVQALDAAHKSGQGAMRISEIMEANGWDMVDEHECSDRCEICSTALRLGNSKVRNNLRRLMKYGVINRPADGTYQLTVETPPEPAIKPSPREFNETESRLVHYIRVAGEEGEADPKLYKLALNMIGQVKKTDCSFYSACLDQALNGDWDGFSCADCTAYALPDQDQRISDMLALRAVQTASDELCEHGKVSRVRGVKPGADAKRTPGHLGDSKTID
jgi:hypothetical protein